MSSQYFWFSIFVILFYLIITDLSVLRFLNLTIDFIKIQVFKFKWWIWYNPRTPWAKYIMWNNSMKLAQELMAKHEERTHTINDSKSQ
jgi:hypothetical protein